MARWRGLAKQLTEAAACPASTSDADYIVWDYARARIRCVYMLVGTRVYNESSSNWGVMQYSLTAGGNNYPNGMDLNSSRMDTLCYLITEFAKKGIRCMLVNNSYREWWVRHGNGTVTYPAGTAAGHGMLWLSSTARAAFKTGFAQIFNYTNPYSGRALCDEPSVMWKIANEDGLKDSILAHDTTTYGGSRAMAMTGNNISGQATITSIASTTYLYAGMAVSGTGVPGGTTIQSVDSGTQVTLTANTTSGTTGGTYTFTDSTSSTHWTDQITTSGAANGNGYWTSEVNTIWDDYCDAISWSPPYGTGFPTRAQCDAMASASADRIALMKVIANIERDAATELYNWAVGFNANMTVGLGEQNYFADMQTFLNPPISRTFTSFHGYLPYWDGTRSANPASYLQRGSSFAPQYRTSPAVNLMNDGGPWGEWIGNHPAHVPATYTEAGQYGENRWNYDIVYASALWAALQDYDLVSMYMGAQQHDQYLGINNVAASDHIVTLRPAHRIALRCVAPMFEHGWLGPLPTSHATTVTNDTIATANATSALPSAGKAFSVVHHQSSWNSGGAEKAFLKKVLHYEWDATTTDTDSGNFPTLSDATYNAATHSSPIVVMQNGDTTTSIGVSPDGIKFNIANRAYGWVNNIQASTTVGKLTTGSSAGTLDTFVLIWRSDTDEDIGTVRSRVFFHGFDYPSDAANFSTTTDGNTVSGDRGDLDAVGLFPPPNSLEITLNTGQDQTVYGLDELHTIQTIISSSYNSGNLTFTLTSSYPEYLLVPK